MILDRFSPVLQSFKSIEGHYDVINLMKRSNDVATNLGYGKLSTAVEIKYIAFYMT